MNAPVTVIGANTVVSGNVEGDEDLTIEGRIEGSITLSKTLTVEINGVVHANINVRNAIISGVLVGNVEAEEAVHITEEGRVVGDIAAPRVILVDGSSFRGSIDMGDFATDRSDSSEAATERRPPMARPAPMMRPAAAPEPQKEVEAPRPAPARTAPARTAPTSRPAPQRATRPAVKPDLASKAPAKSKSGRRAPAPKVRAVGKSKALKKKK